MNKIILLVVFLSSSILFAQDKGFNYKAIITENGDIIQNQNVNIRFSILENGTTVVYKESHSLTTDNNGIVITNIGEGTPITNTFSSVNWRNEQFLKVEIDTNSGSGYTNFGTTALKYAPYAKTAEKLLPTDNITIGNNIMQDERLFIESQSVTNGEVVDFRLTNPSQYNDILNLHMDNAPSSGRAQFIEASRGSSIKFKVDDDGRVYTPKGYYTDGYVSAIGDIESYGTIHAIGNLVVDGQVSNLNMGDNEIHGTDSGDADMKAFLYGSFSTTSNVTIYPNESSAGFTVSYMGTGKYRVYLPNGVDEKYLNIICSPIQASESAHVPSILLVKYPTWGTDGYFEIHQYNLSGQLTNNGDCSGSICPRINFIAYKK